MQNFRFLKGKIPGVLAIVVMIASMPFYSSAYEGMPLKNEEVFQSTSENNGSDLENETASDNDGMAEDETASGNDGVAEDETASGNDGKAEDETASGNDGKNDDMDAGYDESTPPFWVNKKPSIKLKRATHDGFILSVTMKNVTKVKRGNIYYKIVAEALNQNNVSDNHYWNTGDNESTVRKDEWPLEPARILEGGRIKVFYKLYEGNTTDAYIKVSELGQGKEKFKITVSMLQTSDKRLPVENPAENMAENNGSIGYETSENSHAEDTGNIRFTTIAGKEGKLKNATTKTPRYETKLTLKKKKNRVFLGEKNANIGEAVFSGNTTYVGIEKAYLHQAPGVWDTENPPMEVFCTPQGKITVNVKEEATPGKYVIAALPWTGENMHAIPAYLQVEVVRSIYHIDLKVPQTIYKKEGKKAGFKAEISYNEGYQYLAPKIKKVTWSILDFKGVEITKEHPLFQLVSVKNGKVSIHKKYPLREGENKFTLCVKAADYAGNETKSQATFEVTGHPLTMGETMIVKRIGENIYRQIDLHQNSLSANDLDNSHIMVLKPQTEQKDIYTKDDFMDNGFTYQSSRPKEVTVDENGKITVLKVVKNIKFTVKPDDGSGQRKSLSKIAVTYSPVKEIGLLVKKEDYTTGVFEQISSQKQYVESGTVSGVNEFYGIKDTLLSVEVVNCENGLKESFSSHKLKVKGGKVISKDGFGAYHISMTSQKLILTLTNLNNGEVKTYEFVNKSVGNLKAVRLITTNKISAFTHASQTATYTIPQEEKGKHEYVLVTLNTTQKVNNIQPGILQSLSMGTIGKPIKMDGKDSFDLCFQQMVDENGRYIEILPFHYKLNVTFGHLDESNQFVADTKPLPISLLVKEPTAPKTKILTLAKQYKMKSTEGSVSLKLKEEGRILTVYGIKNDNIKGQSNHFTDYFTLEGNTIKLNIGNHKAPLPARKYTGWIEGGLYVDENGEVGYLQPTKITVEVM